MSRLDSNAITECLYDDIPSDDQSYASGDSVDDRDYLPSEIAISVVQDNSSSDLGNEDDDLVEIFNLNDNEIFELPSSHKVCKNLRSYK